jgi:membrane-bound metal-dependent hydrolase YbcI (DUF457 family)
MLATIVAHASGLVPADLTASDPTAGLLADRISLLLTMAVAVVAASVPDLDLRWLPRHPWIGRILPHRGPSHSLLGLLLVGGPPACGLFVVGLCGCGLALLVGWGSHILLDGLTPAGVALLWPWRRRLRLLPRPLRWRPASRRRPRVASVVLLFALALALAIPSLAPLLALAAP